MTQLEKDWNGSRLGKAVKAAGLGAMMLEDENAVLVHDTDYTTEPKTEEEKNAMKAKVDRAIEDAFGCRYREATVMEDPNAGRGDAKVVCTSAACVFGRNDFAGVVGIASAFLGC